MKLYENVGVDLPAPLESLSELSFWHRADDHGYGKLTGLIHEEDVDTWAQTADGAGITVYDMKGGKNRVFAGLITNIRVRKGRQLQIELEFASRSVLMDIEKKSRSFQKTGGTFEDRLLAITREHGGDFMDRSKSGKTIRIPYIQLEETDWEFIKRLASAAGEHICPGIKGDIPQIYMGFGDGGKEGIFSLPDTVEKQVKEALCFQQYKSETEQSFLLYRVKSYDRYQLGDQIRCAGMSLQVLEVHGWMEHGEWIYQYGLGQKKGQPLLERKNKALKGKTLMGTVLTVGKDQVKIHLDIDKEQKEADAFWYPFKRIDWYCMPELGARVGLYLPSDDESRAYVTGVHRTDGEENEKSQDPQVKYLGTQPGEEWKFSPEGIQFHGSEERIFMRLDEEEGIQIQSQDNISMTSQGGIFFRGDQIEIEGGERVLLHTKQTFIVMDHKVQMKG